jgi:hypothetical protein
LSRQADLIFRSASCARPSAVCAAARQACIAPAAWPRRRLAACEPAAAAPAGTRDHYDGLVWFCSWLSAIDCDSGSLAAPAPGSGFCETRCDGGDVDRVAAEEHPACCCRRAGRQARWKHREALPRETGHMSRITRLGKACRDMHAPAPAASPIRPVAAVARTVRSRPGVRDDREALPVVAAPDESQARPADVAGAGPWQRHQNRRDQLRALQNGPRRRARPAAAVTRLPILMPAPRCSGPWRRSHVKSAEEEP